MCYARWCKENEMKSALNEITLNEKINRGGIPIINTNKKAYLLNKEAHTLVIGASGSGKTQTTILPLIKTALLSGESVVINDVKGELYQTTAHNFKERGYEVIVLNFDNPNLGSSWNPLTLPYQLYKENKQDNAIKLIEDLGYYLFNDLNNKENDQFWVNSSIDYFTGLILYLFENAKLEEINLNSVYSLANELENSKVAEKFLKKLTKNSNIYYNVLGTLTSPIETKGGILATFNQKLKKYIALNDLSNMLARTDFDIKEFPNKKTAIFIVSGISSQSSYLIPLLVSQLINIKNEYSKTNNLLNVILDEFDTMIPINNFGTLINYSRSISIRFTVVIKSYINLKNMYGIEDSEIIKSCFPNIIYLLSNDIYTLDEISKLCGNIEHNHKVRPLITIEELKTLQVFESIILIPRMMPFKTKLLPDYKIDWNLEKKEMKFKERKILDKKIYELNLN